MSEIKAYLKYLRIAPRKTRLLADLVRGMDVRSAKAHLNYSAKKGAEPILKLIKSAEANAKHNFKMEAAELFVKEIRVDGGPVLKRHMPASRGRASVIRKRTSHVTLVLAEKEHKHGEVKIKNKEKEPEKKSSGKKAEKSKK
jgi:large subunit ribosomal protein L22